MVFKPIFKSLFKPIFKNIFSPDSNFPPNSNNLISWTFTKTLDSLYSKDLIVASEENAKFVSSYCVSFPGGTGNELNYGNNYSVGTNSHTIAAWIKPAAFSAFQGIVSKRSGTTSEYCFYVNNGALGVYDGGATYQSTAVITLNDWNHVAYTYDYATKKCRFFLNGSFVDEFTQVRGYDTTSTNDMRIGIVGSGGTSQSFNGCIFSVRIFNSKLADADITTLYNNTYQSFASEIGTFVFQGSTFDLVRKVRANTITGATFAQGNDKFHYNLIHGFDKYSEDASPTNIIYIPYVAGVPVVSSLTGFTKVSSHPSGKWHNGAETKVVVGTTGTKDPTNGWEAKTTFKDKTGNDYTPAEADPNEIFVRHTTAPVGYCKEIDLNTFSPVQAGEYIFWDNTVISKGKNLLWYGVAPTFEQNVKVKKFVNKNDFMVFDDGYFYDENGFAITYS